MLRIEYFDFDPRSPSKFEYSHTVDMQPAMGKKTLPCNLRIYPDLQAMAISPDLAGPVAVLDSANTVVSVVNVSVLLAAEEHKHPHGQPSRQLRTNASFELLDRFDLHHSRSSTRAHLSPGRCHFPAQRRHGGGHVGAGACILLEAAVEHVRPTSASLLPPLRFLNPRVPGEWAGLCFVLTLCFSCSWEFQSAWSG